MKKILFAIAFTLVATTNVYAQGQYPTKVFCPEANSIKIASEGSIDIRYEASRGSVAEWQPGDFDPAYRRVWISAVYQKLILAFDKDTKEWIMTCRYGYDGQSTYTLTANLTGKFSQWCWSPIPGDLRATISLNGQKPNIGHQYPMNPIISFLPMAECL
jgi:hypothetical protein